MSGFRTPEIPRGQIELWSARLDDAVPIDHPVRLFDQLIRSSFFSETFRSMESGYVLVAGKPPYHPRDLASLFLYGMINGIRSSRQLEAACYNRVDVMWLMQGQKPDHATIASFVHDHGKMLRKLLKDSIQVAVEAGLVSLTHVAIDGTRIRADAGKQSVKGADKIKQKMVALQEEIARLEEDWQRNEEAERLLFTDKAAWCPSSKRSDRQRLASMERKARQLEKSLARIARRQEEAAPGAKVVQAASMTDPDSRVMPSKEGGRHPNYSQQLAVDADHWIIVGTDVNDEVDDQRALLPMIARVRENCGAEPAEISADSNYNNGPVLKEIEGRGLNVYMPDSNSQGQSPTPECQEALRKCEANETLTDADWAALPRKNKIISSHAFTYDADRDAFRCPAGAWLRFLHKSTNRKRCGTIQRKRYGGAGACSDCPHRTACCPKNQSGRRVYRDEFEEYRERHREKMKRPESKTRYASRKQTVEPEFGHLKRNLGFRRFSRRGAAGVQTEGFLVCVAANIQRLLGRWPVVQAVL